MTISLAKHFTRGTCTIEDGSNLVTGDGTNWLGDVEPGFAIFISGELYEIEDVQGATQLTVSPAFDASLGNPALPNGHYVFVVLPTDAYSLGINKSLQETARKLDEQAGVLPVPPSHSIENSQLAMMPPSTIKGRFAGSTGEAQDITPEQLGQMLENAGIVLGGSSGEPSGNYVPDGGTLGQVLTKNSSVDGDAVWQTPAAPGILDSPLDGLSYARSGGAWTPITPVPAGGSMGQLLAKATDADGALQWVSAPLGLPVGGAPGQVLTKVTGATGDVTWAYPATITVPGDDEGDDDALYASYRYWRIYVVENNGDNAWTSFTGVTMKTADGVNRSAGGTAAASSADLSPANAFVPWVSDEDGNGWRTAFTQAQPCWVSYDMGAEYAITSVTIAAERASVRAPKTFIVQGSTDNAAWIDVSTYVDQIGWQTGGAIRTFEITPLVPEEHFYVPTGGTTGQLLGKASDEDGAVAWVDAPQGSGGGSSGDGQLCEARFTKPILTDFGRQDISSEVQVVQTSLGIHMFTLTDVATKRFHLLTQVPPAGDTFDFVVRVNDHNVMVDNNGLALVLLDGTGKFITLEQLSVQGKHRLEVNRWNPPFTYVSTLYNEPSEVSPYRWFRWKVEPASLTTYVSQDGIAWRQFGAPITGSDRSFLGPITKVGFGIKSSANGSVANKLSAHFLSCALSLPTT